MAELTRIHLECADGIRHEEVTIDDIDPLGELTAIEQGIRLYSRKHDRYIRVQLGDYCVATIQAFRDLVPAMDDLLLNMLRFAQAESFRFVLPELNIALSFSDAGDGLARCDVHEDGNARRKEFLLSRKETVRHVAESLSAFLSVAVDDGFVSKSDATTFLDPLIRLARQ